MQELERAFEQATQDVRGLPERPDNATLLALYALFKQATVGDVDVPRPGFFDYVGSAKYEAWLRLKGMDRANAMRRYVELAERLRG